MGKVNKVEIPTRKLDELIAKYTLVKEIRDIYVEGIADRAILEWYFQKTNKINVVVYEIQTVEIPEAVLQKHGLNYKCNRSKIIALSTELLTTIQNSQNVLCIIDKDFSHIIREKASENNILKLTDYTCMEMYFFCKEIIEKFITLVLHGLIFSSDQVLVFSQLILPKVYAIRLTNKKLGWNLTWVDVWKDIDLSRDHFGFDEQHFLQRYLMANSRICELSVFNQEMGLVKNNLPKDPRDAIHGHDFIDFLCAIVQKYKKTRRGLCEREIMMSTLSGCLEIEILNKEPLFKKLDNFS
ncbi:MAG: DUF4435 domain-containing protein [Ignavibacteriales bacterium]|nr:MAG: DUF4435 domain-containing protein [Ignavibacteriales bacterium]